jgi:hypothetical protein
MTDIPAPEHDPWAKLLTPKPAGPRPEFRRGVLLRTLQALRRRVWLHRLGVLAAMAACYLAGILTVHLTATPSRTGSDNVAVKPPEVAPPPPENETPVVRAPAVALENQACDSATKRPDLYRLAGDRYAEEEGDLRSAVRCYQQALDETPAKDRAITPDDNWLLMALKTARQKEEAHAANVP